MWDSNPGPSDCESSSTNSNAKFIGVYFLPFARRFTDENHIQCCCLYVSLLAVNDQSPQMNTTITIMKETNTEI